jgi:hypothetical protein
MDSSSVFYHYRYCSLIVTAAVVAVVVIIVVILHSCWIRPRCSAHTLLRLRLRLWLWLRSDQLVGRGGRRGLSISYRRRRRSGHQVERG